MHEKVDHLPTQSLKNKQKSGTDKINQINYLFNCYMLSFTYFLYVILNKILCPRIFDGNILQNFQCYLKLFVLVCSLIGGNGSIQQ